MNEMKLTMNIQSDFIRKFLVAKATNPLLVRLKMTTHVLVVRILRHVNKTEATTEHLRISFELIFAHMSTIVLESFKRQAAKFALTDIVDAEINFRSSPLLVHASVLGNPRVRRVFLPARLTDVPMCV